MKKLIALSLALCLLFNGLVVTGYASESHNSDTQEQTQAHESSAPSIENASPKYIFTSPEEDVLSFASDDNLQYVINITNSTPYDALVISYATTVNVTLDDYRRDAYAYTRDGIALPVNFTLDESKYYDEILTDYHNIEFEEIILYIRAFIDGQVVDGTDYTIYVLPTENGIFISGREKYDAYTIYLNNLLENELITDAQYNDYIRSIATLNTVVEYDDAKDADAAIEAKLAELNSGTIALKHLPSTFESLDTPPTLQANKNSSSIFETSSENVPIISAIPKVNTRAAIPAATANRVRIDRTIIASNSEIKVYGTAYWYDINGNVHPLRGANVTVWDKDALTNQNYGNMYSDDQGTFSFTIANDTSWLEGGLDIFIEINSYGNGFTVKKYNAGLSIYANNFYFCTGVEDNVKSNLAMKSYICDQAESDERDRAFQVHQALYTGYRYFRAMNSNSVKAVNAFYPYISDTPTEDTSFSNSTGIFILPDDGLSWDVILHELGHQVEDYLTIKSSYSIPSHYIHENLAENYGKSTGIRAAWGEGWATYFAFAAQNYFNYNLNLSISTVPTACNALYEHVTVTGSSYTITSYDHTATAGKGEANEGAITSILLKLNSDSNIDLTDQQLWNIAKTSKAKSLSEFMAAFYNQISPTKISLVGAVLQRHNCVDGAVMSSPAYSVFTKTSPGTFKWTPLNTKDTIPDNNHYSYSTQFKFVFWDDDYNKIFESPYLSSASVNPQTTLTTAQWNTIVGAIGNGTFYWGIATYQNSASPSTGPYYSELHRGIFDENVTNISTFNSPISRTLSAGDEHWYKFTVSSKATYQIFSTGSTDTKGYLFKTLALDDSSSCWYNDDNGEGSNFLIEQILDTNFSSPYDKTYYFKVVGFSQSTTGSYSVKVVKVD